MKRFQTVAVLFVVIAPAVAAVEIDDASRTCEESPACSLVGRDAEGGATFVISGSPNHSTYVRCP